MRDPFPLLVLGGLIMDIVGAFLLASEFIGLQRVQTWANQLGRALHYVRLAPRVLIVVLLIGFAMTTRYRVTQLVEVGRPNYPPPISLPALTILSVYLTGLLFFLVFRLHRFLALTPAWAENRKAGVLGFRFVLIGFVCQFLGTLGTFILANTSGN